MSNTPDFSDVASQAAKFVSKYEGFLPRAVFDVNAYRGGHGSDTFTNPDGTFRKVVKGDTFTMEDADRDLARRIKDEFIPRLQKKIGLIEFNNLSDNAKIALLSLAYNYGNITKPKIVTAAQNGDEHKLAETIVSATYNDNKKLPESVRTALRQRRKAEADLIWNDSARSARKGGSGMNIFNYIIFAALLYAGWYFFLR